MEKKEGCGGERLQLEMREKRQNLGLVGLYTNPK